MSISVSAHPGDGGLQIALNGNVNRYDLALLAAHCKWFMSCLARVCSSSAAMVVDAIDWIS
jgi:hypothetical protein